MLKKAKKDLQKRSRVGSNDTYMGSQPHIGIGEYMNVMNKNLQVWGVKWLLKKKGIDPQVVDVWALVDSRLSFPENIRVIEETIGKKIRVQKKGAFNAEVDKYASQYEDQYGKRPKWVKSGA